VSSRSLLALLKAMIERSYGMPPVIEDVAPFIIGDAGYAALYGRAEGARLLVRETSASLRVSLYYPDALVRHLERFNPMTAVGDENIDAFGVFIEELDHLLTLASRAAESRPVSRMELEHHAMVTKYLVVIHFLGRQVGRRRVPDTLRRWARHHLLERYTRAEGEDPGRYREAAWMAGKYLRYLDSLPTSERPAELRAYQRRPLAETTRLFTDLN
jgi:hypothetical protein